MSTLWLAYCFNVHPSCFRLIVSVLAWQVQTIWDFKGPIHFTFFLHKIKVRKLQLLNGTGQFQARNSASVRQHARDSGLEGQVGAAHSFSVCAPGFVSSQPPLTRGEERVIVAKTMKACMNETPLIQSIQRGNSRCPDSFSRQLTALRLCHKEEITSHERPSEILCDLWPVWC